MDIQTLTQEDNVVETYVDDLKKNGIVTVNETDVVIRRLGTGYGLYDHLGYIRSYCTAWRATEKALSLDFCDDSYNG